jgi:hypothetical protein
MASDASNVRVGVTGAVYTGDSGTTLPTDATTELDAGLADVGYISEDGVVESHDTDSNDIRAWQNGDVVRKVQTSHDVTFGFTMLETTETTLAAFYGNYTPGEGAEATDATVEITGGQLPRGVWVLSVLDGDHILRIVIPDGQITDRGDITYANGEAVGREVTITAYPVDGVKATIYLDTATEEAV